MNNNGNQIKIKDLVKQNIELKEQILEANENLEKAHLLNEKMWELLVEISRRLQGSSASIKAAVSSLLSYDIFWDGSAQHEFLEIIDDSVDKLSNQITLLSLVFLSESNNLDLKCEPNDAQEIISAVIDKTTKLYPDKIKIIKNNQVSKPIFVDYEYFSLALSLIFDIIFQSNITQHQLAVTIKQVENDIILEITGINEYISDILSTEICLTSPDKSRNKFQIIPSIKLKLLVSCKILDYQSIHTEIIFDEISNSFGLCINIPTVMNE